MVAYIKNYMEEIGKGIQDDHREDSQQNLFFATEWNIDFSCRSLIHDNLLKAPFITHVTQKHHYPPC
jgi:hypothetical protein